jgi:hypothetical protein
LKQKQSIKKQARRQNPELWRVENVYGKTEQKKSFSGNEKARMDRGEGKKYSKSFHSACVCARIFQHFQYNYLVCKRTKE